jgi:hypothetical protein
MPQPKTAPSAAPQTAANPKTEAPTVRGRGRFYTALLTIAVVGPLAGVAGARGIGGIGGIGNDRPAQPATLRVVSAPAAAATAVIPATPAIAEPALPAALSTVPAAPAPAAAVPAVLHRAAMFADKAKGLSPEVLAMALDAVACAEARGVDGRDDLLTVIDYSLPSTEPRLWVLDLEKGEVLYHELVAHGAGTGELYATRFSNVKDSRQTSLGLFRTGGTYMGGNGYSLKLQGLDKGFNDRAEERHIVMHGAWYVSAEHARSQGRIGRSWGCPAVSDEVAQEIIDLIKGGSFVFSYSGTDTSWRQASTSALSSCSDGGAGRVTGTSSVLTAK